MYENDRFVVVVKDDQVELQPTTSEIVPGVPCIFGNSTNQTAYLWHWPNKPVVSELPTLLIPISPGRIVTLYYPTSYYVRATHEFDRCANAFKEATVGDRYRRVALMQTAA